MTTSRQQLLRLWTWSPDLESHVVSWSFYDGAAPERAPDHLPERPPYPSPLVAMRDGWRVLSVSQAQASVPGHEHRTGFLRHEVLLERLVDGAPAADPACPATPRCETTTHHA